MEAQSLPPIDGERTGHTLSKGHIIGGKRRGFLWEFLLCPVETLGSSGLTTASGFLEASVR